MPYRKRWKFLSKIDTNTRPTFGRWKKGYAKWLYKTYASRGTRRVLLWWKIIIIYVFHIITVVHTFPLFFSYLYISCNYFSSRALTLFPNRSILPNHKYFNGGIESESKKWENKLFEGSVRALRIQDVKRRKWNKFNENWRTSRKILCKIYMIAYNVLPLSTS